MAYETCNKRKDGQDLNGSELTREEQNCKYPLKCSKQNA